ncbi:hypothetical protein CYLTODRAFT_418524, partial [Cylindrobasidium torrendii FP15055 ss-10]
MTTFAALPIDILLYIFELVSRRPENSLNVAHEPWSLGRVCREWRATLLSTSALWSTVIVTEEAMARGGITNTDILKEYLARSQSHALHIGLHETDRPSGAGSEGEHDPVEDIEPTYEKDKQGQENDTGEIFHAHLLLLLAECHRWKICEMLANRPTYIELSRTTTFDGRNYPLLEEFYLKTSGQSMWAADIRVHSKVVKRMMTAPRLRSLDARDAYLLLCPGNNTTITHLGTRVCNFDEISKLQSYQSLTELHIICDWPYRLSPAFKPITLPNVRKLSSGNSPVLQYLILPNLTTLTLREFERCAPHNLMKFLDHSQCRLDVLSLLSAKLLASVDLTSHHFRSVHRLSVPMGYPHVLECLSYLEDKETLPNLGIVSIMSNPKTGPVFHTSPNFIQPDLPDDLEEQGFGEAYTEERLALMAQRDADPKLLRGSTMNFLKKRFRGGGSLKLVRLCCDVGDLHALLDAGLRELKSEGLLVMLDQLNSNHDGWMWWRGPYWFTHDNYLPSLSMKSEEIILPS